MILDNEVVKMVVGGLGTGRSPELPPREEQAAEQQKVELSSTDTIAPVEPLKP